MNMIPVIVLVFACIQLTVSEEYAIPPNIDLDDILANDRLLKNYVNCVLDKGRCTPEGEQLKKSIPEALQTECAKCNETHRQGIRKVIHHLIKNKPDLWKELEAKFDPTGEYRKKYKKLIEQEGLNI